MVRMLQAAAVALLLLAGSTSVPVTAADQQTIKPTTDPGTLADFVKRVEAYVKLHRKLEATLPKLPDQTDPYQIDRHERAMLRLMQEARKDAKQGDLFTPAMQRYVRNLLLPLFSGPDGRQARAELFDTGYTGTVKLVVNARYPDEVPISSVPPQILAQLPKLPEDLEYRFVQNNMILFDPHAHIIADYIPNAFK